MLRFRRYRIYLLVAAVFTILIIRLRHSDTWSSRATALGIDRTAPKVDNAGTGGGLKPDDTRPPAGVKDKEKEAVKISKSSPITSPKTSVATKAKEVIRTSAAASIPKSSPPSVETIPKVVLPDRNPLPPTKVSVADENEDDIHAIGPPGRQEFPIFSAVPTTIHWERQVEHFPVPTESLIALPTGEPIDLPQIQHKFTDETTDAKISREKRLGMVKAEFQKAWKGYKDYAWLHDELSPVSGKFRDPFCGWAATLVDSLDTLWIMGLQEEFEEAARAVDMIDFTTSTRGDIPVFETTIRYMGGLLAAYDVSGGQYKNLLNKAVELGDIILGAFDTPNRMPLLYYHWKPAFASQPHRASQRSNLAELGSLSMEFTRLAQLTQNPRYYDAVARVTDALLDWQERGTKLGGVFPENVDASGCNRTVQEVPISSSREPSISPALSVEEPTGYQPNTPDDVVEPRPNKKETPTGPGSLELQVTPGEPGKARIVGWEDRKHTKRDVPVSPKVGEAGVKKSGGVVAVNSTSTPIPVTDSITGLPLDIPGAKAKIGKSVGEWDCVPQGLESASGGYGAEKYSMGGGQDSTYEYFPKQYLLLGGLEQKYATMYLKTIDAIRKYMLYRPMIPDNRDILFSGSVTTYGDPENDITLTPEVEHLTCFIGGMVGMGAKLFGLDGDLEIAKKLTDGCVWAYESMPSGIMPEGSNVMPCKSSQHCTWNQTAYWEFLDPIGSDRDNQIKEYIERKEALAKEAAAEAEATALRLEAEKINSLKSEQHRLDDATTADFETTDPAKGSSSLAKDTPVSLQRRQLDPSKDLPKPITHNFKEDVKSEKILNAVDQKLKEKSEHTEAELALVSQTGRQADISEKPLTTEAGEVLPDPMMPLTHKQYVEQRVKQESLPPGYTSIRSRKYILRPEAIESVWYMYRITGDTIWQDKGWRMFESIINATSTKYGHSAVYDVTSDTPYKVDEMESFWLAETLKYFYLLYSTPDTISLDEYVLNTEAHPFKRPT